MSCCNAASPCTHTHTFSFPPHKKRPCWKPKHISKIKELIHLMTNMLTDTSQCAEEDIQANHLPGSYTAGTWLSSLTISLLLLFFSFYRGTRGTLTKIVHMHDSSAFFSFSITTTRVWIYLESPSQWSERIKKNKNKNKKTGGMNK